MHNPLECIDPLGLEKVYTAPVDVYQGVKDSSAYLKSQGVSRNRRKQILDSFEVDTIKLRTASKDEYGLRYFDGINANAKGRYLFETFPASRESLALKPEWNQMTNIVQYRIRPGATIIEGRASAQGAGFSGGQVQK